MGRPKTQKKCHVCDMPLKEGEIARHVNGDFVHDKCMGKTGITINTLRSISALRITKAKTTPEAEIKPTKKKKKTTKQKTTKQPTKKAVKKAKSSK